MAREFNWVDRMEEELQQLSPLSNWSIWRVPINLRMVNEDAYIPRVISIGPFHHGRNNVVSMEIHKLSYLLSFLQRTPNMRHTLDACANTIEGFDKTVRDCYAEPIALPTPDLAKMLLVDGCFILELFLRYFMVELRQQDDPIFNTSWMMLGLQHDLALLENQIPFFLLEWLFELVVLPSSIGQFLSTLPELALCFFQSSDFRWNEGTFRVSRRQFPHLLGLIHSCYVPGPRTPKLITSRKDQLKDATFLIDVGIVFQKSTARNLFDLKFENGVVKIPTFHIYDHTDSFFRNLIAYEQFYYGSAQYVTSYVYLMSHLVTTVRDAELLQNKGILEKDLGGWEELIFLLNNMCKQVVWKEFYYAEICDVLNEYSQRPAWRYQATLRRHYFRNPWTMVLLVAAYLLLTLIMLQTAYTVLSYYRH